MVTARTAKGRTAAGEWWRTLDFILIEEDIQMTGIRVPEGRVPGSSVGGQKGEVTWTDDRRHRDRGTRSRGNAWRSRHVDPSGRVWWFERLLACNPLLVAILCITQSVQTQTKCPCETCLKNEKKCSLKIFKES